LTQENTALLEALDRCDQENRTVAVPIDLYRQVVAALSSPTQSGGDPVADANRHRYTGNQSDLRLRFDTALAGMATANGDSGWIMAGTSGRVILGVSHYCPDINPPIPATTKRAA
jgi:hypothetical protein